MMRVTKKLLIYLNLEIEFIRGVFTREKTIVKICCCSGNRIPVLSVVDRLGHSRSYTFNFNLKHLII